MSYQLPDLVAHADWGSSNKKCWSAIAVRKEGTYSVSSPRNVSDKAVFLAKLERAAGGGGSLFVGFDFPIGLPSAYADRAEVPDFTYLLPHLGSGKWSDFFAVAAKPSEISLFRPFYPQKATQKGIVSRIHLQAGLGLSWEQLFRQCELAHADRGSACPLFWTLGGNQVGKSAIDGWRNILIPGLRDSKGIAIWPFSGDLFSMFESHRVVIAETYPAEFYNHLGLDLSLGRTPQGRSGKRVQSSRLANAERLLRWAERAQVVLDPGLRSLVRSGFGKRPEAEDSFDAVVGLFGMLNIVLGNRSSGELPPAEVLQKEGWILGQSMSGIASNNS